MILKPSIDRMQNDVNDMELLDGFDDPTMNKISGGRGHANINDIR